MVLIGQISQGSDGLFGHDTDRRGKAARRDMIESWSLGVITTAALEMPLPEIFASYLRHCTRSGAVIHTSSFAVRSKN